MATGVAPAPASIIGNADPMSYSADYRNSAVVVPVLLLMLALYFAVLAWAIKSLASDDSLLVLASATGVMRKAFVPWADIAALRQIEVQTSSGALHRMSQQLLADDLGRRCIPDNAGFAASVAIAGARLIVMPHGTNLYGAALQGGAIIFLLPVGAGYLIYQSVKRHMRVLEGR